MNLVAPHRPEVINHILLRLALLMVFFITWFIAAMVCAILRNDDVYFDDDF